MFNLKWFFGIILSLFLWFFIEGKVYLFRFCENKIGKEVYRSRGFVLIL